MKKLFSLIVAVLLVGSFSLPALAQVEVKHGANVWTQAGMNMNGINDLSGMAVAVSGLSRLNWSIVIDKKTRAFVEIRPGTEIQQAYATADFAGGELLAGLTESLFDLTWGKTAWSGTPLLIRWGKAWGGRIAQLRYTSGALKIGLATPSMTVTAFTNTTYTLPRIEGSYGLDLAGNKLTVSGLLEMIKSNKVNNVGVDSNAMAYGVACVADVAAGPAKVTANVYMGQNLGTALLIGGGTTNRVPIYRAAKDEVEKSSEFGGYVDASIPMGDNTLCAGFGMATSDNPDTPDQDVSRTAIFVDYRIKVGPNVTLIPSLNIRKESIAGTDSIDDTGVNLIVAAKF